MSMKRNLLICLFTCLLYVVSYAQIDESKPFIITRNDNVVYAKHMDMTSGLFRNYLIVDKKKYDIKDIKFVNGGRQFFANTSNVFSRSNNFLAERIEKGKINLYELEVISTTRTSTTTSTTRSKHFFFNTEYNDVERLKIKTLMPYVQNNQQSMQYLNMAKSTEVAEWTFAISGLGLMAAGAAFTAIRVIQFENDDPFSNDFPKIGLPLVIFGGGIGIALTSSVFGRQKIKQIRMAVTEFNKTD